MATEELIGEQLVDASSVYAVADSMFEEAQRLWASTSSGWYAASKAPVSNESIPVSGALADARVDVWRASATLNAPAQLVFDLIVSHEGRYTIIDPYTAAKDALPPLETFDSSKWRGGEGIKRLEAATTVAKIPFMYAREFVVLNAVDHHSRIYVSKSILHEKAPGGSVWGPAEAAARQDPKMVRGINSFAVRVTEVDGEDAETQCVVEFVNYANLAGSFSSTVQNQFNKLFLTGIIGRLQKAVEQDRVITKAP